MPKPIKAHTVAIKLSNESYEALKDYRFDHRIDKLSEAAASIVLEALGRTLMMDDAAAAKEAMERDTSV